jgi:hypothetical protein
VKKYIIFSSNAINISLVAKPRVNVINTMIISRLYLGFIDLNFYSTTKIKC